ncbi:hypothetical protein Tco_1011135 [Tanacetum coccineum]
MSKEEQLAADIKKAIKASKEAFRLQQQTGDSSEGAGITPEVLDELTGKFTTSSKGAGIVLEGSKDDSHQSDDEQVNEGHITWLSTDEEEKGNDDDDEDDDDRSPPSEALTTVLQRVLTLEKDVKELKQVDHSAVIFNSIRSQVPPVVNEFLGSSLGDSLQKVLQKHTEELKQELKQQEYHKHASKIINIKQDHASKQK